MSKKILGPQFEYESRIFLCGKLYIIYLPKIICVMHAAGLKEITLSVSFWIEINDKIVCKCYMFIVLV